MNREPAQQSTRKGGSTNLILAGTLIAVCAFAYWLEVRKKSEMQHSADSSGRLLAIDPNSEVEKVQIVDKAKNINVELVCSENCKFSSPNSVWQMVAPIKFKADESNVGTFVASVGAATTVDTLALEGDFDAKLGEFGLGKEKRDEVKAVIKLKKDSEPFTIYMGENTAVGENMYVYATGPDLKSNVVKIIPSFVKTNVTRDLSYWRAKRLFDFAMSEVEGLTLKNPNGTVNLSRDGANWYLMPGKALADNEAVDTYLTGLVFMNAQDYVSDDKAKDAKGLGIGPATPHYALDIKIAKRPPVHLDVYDFVKDKTPHLYAVLADKNYVVSLEHIMADKFAKKPESFRFNKLLTAAEKQDVVRVQLKLSKKESYEFKQENSKWTLATGKIDMFDGSTVDTALNKVGGARIAEFRGKLPIPAGNELLSAWTLLDKNGNKLREFSIYGNTTKNDYFVKLSTGETGKLEKGSGSMVPHWATDFVTVPSSENAAKATKIPAGGLKLPQGITIRQEKK